LDSDKLASLTPAFPVLSAFSEQSGLLFNMQKSCLVQTGWTKKQMLSFIEGCPWPTLLLEKKHTYLGLLIGRGVRADDVFLPLLRKFAARLNAVAPILQSQSLQKKVRIINTFLTPIFSYHGRFLVIPREICRAAE